MCERKPGKRCAADTKPRMTKLAEQAVAAQRSGDGEGTQQALTELRHTCMDYWGTRTGRAELQAQIDAYQPPADWRDTTDEHLRKQELADIARSNLATGEQLVTMRRAAVTACDSNPDAPAEARAAYADLLEAEMYAQLDAADDPHHTRRDRLEQLMRSREEFAARTGFAQPDTSDWPMIRCSDCGAMDKPGHRCSPIARDPQRMQMMGRAAAAEGRFPDLNRHPVFMASNSHAEPDTIAAAEEEYLSGYAEQRARLDNTTPEQAREAIQQQRARVAAAKPDADRLADDIDKLVQERHVSGSKELRERCTPDMWANLSKRHRQLLSRRRKVGEVYWAVGARDGDSDHVTVFGSQYGSEVDPIDPTLPSQDYAPVFTREEDARAYFAAQGESRKRSLGGQLFRVKYNGGTSWTRQ